MMKSDYARRVIEIARKTGVLRPRDLEHNNIPRQYLNILFHQGYFQRIARGLYEFIDRNPTDNATLVEVSKKVPKCVICLLTALRFHGLTTQSPHAVWIAIDRKTRSPNEPNLPIRVMRFSGKSLTAGIIRKQIEGVKVKVYNPAKTVADCFKYRNKVGKDVAIEALRDCLQQKLCTADELWKYAKICRVANVMKPYLEAMI
jgi:predicted transcriptional regulator of viral defense system